MSTYPDGPTDGTFELMEAMARELGRANEEIIKLRMQKFAYFNEEECWIYQGDGTDELESLVCPVLISAKDLIELEKAAGKR
jgi:hypothetical protein